MPRGEARAPDDGVLFQEWIQDPFWMVVACQLVNLTTWRQARPAFDWLVDVYEGPEALAHAGLYELYLPLRPLWRRRAVILPRFSHAWLRSRPTTAEELSGLPGCGWYACDSWAIFVEGRRDVAPIDGKLIWFLDRREAA
jgi:endonuclease III